MIRQFLPQQGSLHMSEALADPNAQLKPLKFRGSGESRDIPLP